MYHLYMPKQKLLTMSSGCLFNIFGQQTIDSIQQTIESFFDLSSKTCLLCISSVSFNNTIVGCRVCRTSIYKDEYVYNAHGSVGPTLIRHKLGNPSLPPLYIVAEINNSFNFLSSPIFAHVPPGRRAKHLSALYAQLSKQKLLRMSSGCLFNIFAQ